MLYSQVWFERALKAKTWLSHILKFSMNTVLFVNTTIGFSENLFLVIVAFLENATIGYSLESVCVCVHVCVCFCRITQKEIDLGTRNQNTL